MLLSEVEPENNVIVEEISGGLPVIKYLKDLGINERVKLKVLSRSFQEPTGAISLRTKGKNVVVPRGWGNAVLVKKGEQTVPLPRLERGEKGTVESIKKRGGGSLSSFLSLIGIKEGREITFLQILPENLVVFELDGKEIRLREGEASKILVNVEGKTIQSNNLQEGATGVIRKVLAGKHLEERLEEREVKEGKRIAFLKREIVTAEPQHQAGYVIVQLGEDIISLGRGIAKKIEVKVKA